MEIMQLLVEVAELLLPCCIQFEEGGKIVLESQVVFGLFFAPCLQECTILLQFVAVRRARRSGGDEAGQNEQQQPETTHGPTLRSHYRPGSGVLSSPNRSALASSSTKS